MSSFSTKVLEAGGNIESRCTAPDMQFQNHYVFTKESLERLIEIVKNEPSPISRAGS